MLESFIAQKSRRRLAGRPFFSSNSIATDCTVNTDSLYYLCRAIGRHFQKVNGHNLPYAKECYFPIHVCLIKPIQKLFYNFQKAWDLQRMQQYKKNNSPIHFPHRLLTCILLTFLLKSLRMFFWFPLHQQCQKILSGQCFFYH